MFSLFCSIAQIYKRLWKLPNTTHYLLLPHTNDCISIKFVLEQRCTKFIWSIPNSFNTINKTTVMSAITRGNSTFGDNYRYLRYKYNIGFHIWMLSLKEAVKCISLYMVVDQNNSLV